MQINKYLKFEKNCPLTLMDQKMMFFGKKQVMEAKKYIYILKLFFQTPTIQCVLRKFT